MFESALTGIAKGIATVIATTFTALVIHPVITVLLAGGVYFGIRENSLVVAGAVFGVSLLVLVIVHMIFKSRSRGYARGYSVLRGWRTKVLAKRAMKKSLRGLALDAQSGDAFVKQPRIKSVEVGD